MTDQETKEKAQKAALQAFDLVLQVANRMLRNAKFFEIATLQDWDPSYEDVARDMTALSRTVLTLSDIADDPLTGTKAMEYSYHVSLMADAIREGDENQLNQLVEQLDKRSFQ